MVDRDTPQWAAFAAAALGHELGKRTGRAYGNAIDHADKMTLAVQAVEREKEPPKLKRGRPRKTEA